MVLGSCKITFRLREVFSLKEKRHFVKKLVGRTKSRFNASVAEVEANDDKRRAVIGIAVAGNDGAFVNSVLDNILFFVEEMEIAEIIDSDIEIITL